MASISSVSFDPTHADSLQGCAFRLDKPSAVAFTYLQPGMTATIQHNASGLVVAIADSVAHDITGVHDPVARVLSCREGSVPQPAVSCADERPPGYRGV